jgi:FAD/FMN-containing dehydrogenase
MPMHNEAAMDRRGVLKLAATTSLLLASLPRPSFANSQIGAAMRRVRPSDPDWPTPAEWNRLKEMVAGRLIEIETPLKACAGNPDGPACQELLRNLRNPFFVGDNPWATRSTGWVDAWTSAPSVYAVAANSAADVSAAIKFAREHNLRLVIKGGGHSFHGTSNAPDSLLIWTRAMDDIALHDGFVPQGCSTPPQPAVSVGAGAIWLHVYDAVTSDAGRFVQGGGCTTVGVAGLIQSGGFGSFSKNYGTAAASLIEAEVVTADGEVRIANACTNPDLFWALKGGGGGSFGVVTRLTLKTYELAERAGAAIFTVKAMSGPAFRALIGKFISFYTEQLFNPHWGGRIAFPPYETLSVGMVSYGLDKAAAQAVWQPFLDWIAAAPQDYRLAAKPTIADMPARKWWDAEFRKKYAADSIVSDPRPGANPRDFSFASDHDEIGAFWRGFETLWLPASLLQGDQQQRLADALYAASRRFFFEIQFDKGLAGAPDEAVAASRDTATNPAVLTAFGLALMGIFGPPVYPGVSGYASDVSDARAEAAIIANAMGELRKVAPESAAYVSESNFFEKDWQRSYWGTNYERLRAIKRQYDPDGLFFVHHGVGSEDWSNDGFVRHAAN